MRNPLTIRRPVLAFLIAGAVVMTSWVNGDTSTVTALSHQPGEGSSTNYVIAKGDAVAVQDFLMEDPPRLVLDFIGARHMLDKNEFEGDGQYVKRVRTSQYSSEPDEVTRVVFDLNEKVTYHVTRNEQSVIVTFGSSSAPQEATSLAALGEQEPAASDVPANPPSGATAWSRPASQTPQSAPSSETSRASDTQAEKSTTPNTAWSPGASKPAQTTWSSAPATEKPDATATSTPSSTTFRPYAAQSGLVSNKNITIDVQNADIKTVLRSMSEFSNSNIISGPEVEGKVTAHLKNVPWRQALDVVLKSHGFGWREEYGVIRVSTIENLTREELELQAAERKKDDLLPLVTRIMPLSFSNGEEMRDALNKMLTQRGSLEVEKGNNALIVTDIQRSVDKIAEMVAELDRKTRQVEIVAKMVDVDFEASREMGVRWDLLNLNFSDVNGVGSAIIDARGQVPAGEFRFGTVNSWGEIQALIEVLENEKKANIISNPRIVTADNREAAILVGKEIPLIVSDEAGNPITELTKVGITLRVIPHVNKDQSITLDLHPEVSELAAEATVQGGVIITLSEADTRVVVKDGETAVIGGLINEVESTFENGIPVLMDLPVLGSFFKFENKTKKKRELIIFVTPRVVEDVG